MFDDFLGFVNENSTNAICSVEDFLNEFNGKTFLNGLYRIFDRKDLAKWTDIVYRAFPVLSGKIKLFGYDWLGRQFAIDNSDGCILLLEPGTGQILGIPKDFIDFHNSEIVNSTDACLASIFFDKWCKKTGNYGLAHDKCVGYKIPLFLNGQDNVDNLELSDMEVYWEIMMPLMKL